MSSLPGRTAQRIAVAVRNHWCVENELPWLLDVCFGENQSRVRIGNAAENLSRVRRLALTLLKQEKPAKIGIKAKRLMAGWNENYLLKVLRIQMRLPWAFTLPMFHGYGTISVSPCRVVD